MSFINHSQYKTAPPARVEQRHEERHSVVLQVVTVDGDEIEKEVAPIVDISSFGCRLEVQGKYAEAIKLELSFFNRDPIIAEVIWCKDGHLGCRFEKKIDMCLFRAITIRTE